MGKHPPKESIPAHRCFGRWALLSWLPSSRDTTSHLIPGAKSPLVTETGPLRPPTPQRFPTPRSAGDIRLPAGNQERAGSAIKSPRFPLFHLPRQLLPRSAGWGSGICHGKQRAGNQFPNCRMLTDMHVTTVWGFGCRRFPPGPSEPAVSLLPSWGRGLSLCKATTPQPWDDPRISTSTLQGEYTSTTHSRGTKL